MALYIEAISPTGKSLQIERFANKMEFLIYADNFVDMLPEKATIDDICLALEGTRAFGRAKMNGYGAVSYRRFYHV